MKVSDVMSTDIVTIFPDTTIKKLWALLFAKHVNALPVVDKKGKLQGIITKEDLLKALYPDYREFFEDLGGVSDFEELEEKVKEIGARSAKEVMNTHITFARGHTHAMRALSRMITRRLNQMPVLSENNEVIGMVTKGDIFYALFKKELNSSHKQSSRKK